MLFTWAILEQIYGCAKLCYEGKLSKSKAIGLAVKLTGMKKGSIACGFNAFVAMMNGEEYMMNINADHMECFLINIEKDYGEFYLTRALIATKKHLIKKGVWGKGGKKEVLVHKFAQKHNIALA